MELSEEILNWYYVGDEIPAKEWATRITELEQQLEIDRLRLAACGTVALANTTETAINARSMLPEYKSASCDDVAAAVDREMMCRAENKRLRDALGWLERNPASGTEVIRSVARKALQESE